MKLARAFLRRLNERIYISAPSGYIKDDLFFLDRSLDRNAGSNRSNASLSPGNFYRSLLSLLHLIHLTTAPVVEQAYAFNKRNVLYSI
jgi:hypothetical protein